MKFKMTAFSAKYNEYNRRIRDRLHVGYRSIRWTEQRVPSLRFLKKKKKTQRWSLRKAPKYQTMSICPSSRADERTRPIKGGYEGGGGGGEGSGLSLASSRLEEPFLDFLPRDPRAPAEGARGKAAE